MATIDKFKRWSNTPTLEHEQSSLAAEFNTKGQSDLLKEIKAEQRQAKQRSRKFQMSAKSRPRKRKVKP